MSYIQSCPSRSFTFTNSLTYFQCFGGREVNNFKSNIEASFGSVHKKKSVITNSLRERSLTMGEPLSFRTSSQDCKNAISSHLKQKDSVPMVLAHTNVEAAKIDEPDEMKSEVYSSNMSKAMGAALTYRHELGMNYNFVLPDLIVGSCPQNPEDVDKLKDIGVRTIFCLQQDSDLAYFDIDIAAIEEHAKRTDGIQHFRAEIRDFDAFDLRMRLPKVISKLLQAIRMAQGITYIHCTAGLGRAPSVALAYMYWVLGYKLEDAHKWLLSVRPCFPKLDAIRSATADMLSSRRNELITFKLKDGNYKRAELSGLDIGWGQKIPLAYNEEGYWILKRELPVGYYEYKYVADDEWICNKDELLTAANNDGHINNYFEVKGDENDQILRKKLSQEVDLTEDERQIIIEKLHALAVED